MCIAGIYGLGALWVVPAMLDAIAHRGPDAAGEYRHPSPQVWLGHRRLSIIDLSEAANQPFVSNGLAIVFNGEIYNYRQLRHQLEGEGIRFRTSSDTEVLLEAGGGGVRSRSGCCAECSPSPYSRNGPGASSSPATPSGSSRCSSTATVEVSPLPPRRRRW